MRRRLVNRSTVSPRYIIQRHTASASQAFLMFLLQRQRVAWREGIPEQKEQKREKFYAVEKLYGLTWSVVIVSTGCIWIFAVFVVVPVAPMVRASLKSGQMYPYVNGMGAVTCGQSPYIHIYTFLYDTHITITGRLTSHSCTINYMKK